MKEFTWDNTKEYTSFSDTTLKTDLGICENGISELEKLAESMEKLIFGEDSLQLDLIFKTISILREITPLFSNLSTYTHCALSLDTLNHEALDLQSDLQKLSTRFSRSLHPYTAILSRFPNLHPKITQNWPQLQFELQQIQKSSRWLLDLSEESLITTLSQDGPTAFKRLYEKLQGSIRIKAGEKTMPWGQAASRLESNDENERKIIWHELMNQMEEHKHSFASILSAQAGWRIEINRLRAKKAPRTVLSPSLVSGRIEQSTLDAMMHEIREFRPKIRNLILSMAKIHKKEKLDLWDQQAPCPLLPPSANMSFEKGMELVTAAYDHLSPKMGEFVRTMEKNHWIDSSSGKNRRPSAYATFFYKSRNPRLFTTWSGSMMSLRTLAHELGHCWHYWCMRDLDQAHLGYPLTLAESASIFGELVLSRYLNQLPDQQLNQAIAWQDGLNAIIYAMNVPMRFDFESRMHAKREQKNLEFNDLDALMNETWTDWFADTHSAQDTRFWATKLHFSLSSFYNFQYSFGYLFAHNLNTWLNQNPQKFMNVFENLLRDTGRMEVAPLLEYHLGISPNQKEFWKTAFISVQERLNTFYKIFGF